MLSAYLAVGGVLILAGLYWATIHWARKSAKTEVQMHEAESTTEKYKNAEKIQNKPAGDIDSIINGL